jgi:hypothetical protein
MKETTMSETGRPQDRPVNRPQGRPSGRHPVNVGHLVMGLAFLGLVGVWALVQGDVVGGRDVRWLLPLPWVLAGIAGLLATTLTGRDRWGAHQTGWVTPDRPAADWGTHHTGWVGSAVVEPEPTAPEPTSPDTEPEPVVTDAEPAEPTDTDTEPTEPTEQGPTASGR